MPLLWGKKYRRDDISRYTGDIRQLAFAQPFEYVDGGERGCRGVLLNNGTGLEISVLVDRGMALYDVSYKGIPLAFKTPLGPIHPNACSDKGFDFLNGFPGGFLTPCGLCNVGSPCVEDGREFGLHGRIGILPASQIASGGTWTHDGGYELAVSGVVRETRLFGENLSLTRKIYTRMGEPRFWIEDAVENKGQDPVPLMFLQHINLGFPLVDEGAYLLVSPCETQPRDDHAEKGAHQWRRFVAPQKEFAEQVFYHDCNADEEGFVHVALINRQFEQGNGIGVCLQYKKEEYPVLVQWKMMKQGCYVCGLEPANCHVQGRMAERERGTLQHIGPGEIRAFNLEIGVLHGAKELDSVENAFDWQGK